ncbi:MAG TPA: type 1 glutamine amidotransferase domain-containing protein [Mariniphaga sp.]|nr:type 1 glutamine amidotransferase domain-containing protein [Mariniphaga sp.]
MNKLNGVRVAMLATNGFEESELFEPKSALEENGAKVLIVAPEGGKIKAWRHGDWSKEINVDVVIDDAKVNDFDVLVIPGGVINPDKLRRDQKVVDFVAEFFKVNKPVASICHGPQLLIEAEVVKGRTMTSFFSIKKDLKNAGANWIDKEVVIDNGLITSRNPQDIPAFNEAMIEQFAAVKSS